MASFDSSSSFLIWLLAVFAALNALVSPVLAGLVIKTRFINMPTTTELPLPPGYSDQASYATSNPNDANYQIYWRVDNTNLYLFLRLKVGTTGQQTFFGNSTWMAVAFGSTMLNAQFLVVHLEKDPSGIMYSNFHEHTSIPGGVYAAPEKINGTVAQWIVQPVSASYSGTVWTAELSRALAPNDQLHWNLQSSGATDMLFAFNPGKQGEKRNFVFHDHNTDTFTTHGHLQLAFDGSLRAQSEPIPNSTMRIAHGIVMLVLWLFWFPFGVFWARYFRFVPGWVNLHVLWQIVGIFAVIVAAVLSITTINWSSPKTIINTPHYYLGFGILAIIVIQASLGLFNRSNLSSADRSEGIAKVFRWAHKTAGWLLLISAYVQMLLGLNALHPCWTQASGCSDGREEGYARWYIYLAFLIFWPVAFLSAEISMATIFNGGLLGYLKEGRMNTRGRKEFDANAITPYSKANSRHSTDDGKDESAAAFLGPNFGRPVNGRSDVEMTTFLAEKTNATGFSNQQEREMFKSRQALLENKFLEAGKKNVQLKQFTWDSLDEAVRSGKIYVVGNGKYVYDATSWVASHPGGAVILHAVAGTDITNDFFYSSFFDAADMRLPPPAQTIALSGTAQRPRHNFAANDEDPSRSLPFQSVAGNEGASDSEEGNQADYPMLSPNDWAVLTRSRRTHVHSNVAIQRLASLRVGELRVEPGLTGAALGLRPLISRTGAVHQFDPYEYRRYALTSKTILVPAALSRRSSSGGMSTSSGGSGNNQRLGGMVVKLRFCLVYPNDSRRGEPVNYLPGDVMQIQVRPTNARSSLLFIGGGANVANPDDFQTRYYTAISGCPMAFELIVKVPDKGGQVATYLAKQVPGQKQYKFRGPFGINYLARSGVPRPIGAHAPPKWVVFVSKGSGLTPFLQLLHYLFLPEHAQTRAIQSYTPADPEELPVEYGDYIVPRAHTMDGWCIAEKQAIVPNLVGYTTTGFGFLPVSFLAPRYGLPAPSSYGQSSASDYKVVLLHYTDSLDTLFGMTELAGAALAYSNRVEFHIVLTRSPGDVEMLQQEQTRRRNLRLGGDEEAAMSGIVCGLTDRTLTKDEKLRHQFVHLDCTRFYSSNNLDGREIRTVLTPWKRAGLANVQREDTKVGIICGPPSFQDIMVESMVNTCEYVSQDLRVLAASGAAYTDELKRFSTVGIVQAPSGGSGGVDLGASVGTFVGGAGSAGRPVSYQPGGTFNGNVAAQQRPMSYQPPATSNAYGGLAPPPMNGGKLADPRAQSVNSMSSNNTAVDGSVVEMLPLARPAPPQSQGSGSAVTSFAPTPPANYQPTPPLQPAPAPYMLTQPMAYTQPPQQTHQQQFVYALPAGVAPQGLTYVYAPPPGTIPQGYVQQQYVTMQPGQPGIVTPYTTTAVGGTPLVVPHRQSVIPTSPPLQATQSPMSPVLHGQPVYASPPVQYSTAAHPTQYVLTSPVFSGAQVTGYTSSPTTYQNPLAGFGSPTLAAAEPAGSGRSTPAGRSEQQQQQQ